jgi:hypothetical protein
MHSRRIITPAIVIFALLLTWAAAAHGDGFVQTSAHLEAPRPPYAYTSWTASPGTAQIVLESTWMVRVNCATGAAIATLGPRQLYSSGSAGSSRRLHSPRREHHPQRSRPRILRRPHLPLLRSPSCATTTVPFPVAGSITRWLQPKPRRAS